MTTAWRGEGERLRWCWDDNAPGLVKCRGVQGSAAEPLYGLSEVISCPGLQRVETMLPGELEVPWPQRLAY
ncbi:hypothetical protein NDU88_003165 [Pleurodeles waltl]|uniref:Uncharacterized protein n=1 Tax=Pleurodeles waltl TaxID=8319 RepID=A0AAV7P8R6_PLEWA|nr:hypothetical protein NDU88_003165 [Pleurodeles waltl]